MPWGWVCLPWVPSVLSPPHAVGGGHTCACIAASAPRSLRSSWATEEEAAPAATKQEEAWPALGDRSLVPMVEQLFSHLLKVINICAHVLDEVAPGPAGKVTSCPGPSLRGLSRLSLLCALSEQDCSCCNLEFHTKCHHPVRSPLVSSSSTIASVGKASYRGHATLAGKPGLQCWHIPACSPDVSANTCAFLRSTVSKISSR